VQKHKDIVFDSILEYDKLIIRCFFRCKKMNLMVRYLHEGEL